VLDIRDIYQLQSSRVVHSILNDVQVYYPIVKIGSFYDMEGASELVQGLMEAYGYNIFNFYETKQCVNNMTVDVHCGHLILVG
jgi:hypothetical protein